MEKNFNHSIINSDKSIIQIVESEQENNNNKNKDSNSKTKESSGIEKIFDKLLYVSEGFYNKIIRNISPFFTISICNLVLFSFCLLHRFLLPYWYINCGFFYYIIAKIFSFFHVFYILINYTLSCITKPGSLDDFKHSTYYKKHNPYITNELSFNHLPKKQGSYLIDFCNKCNENKPIRAHHCSLCGICVLKMDHHCPWINNCIGLNNHRFFVLFITHLCLFCLFIIVINVPVAYSYFFLHNQSQNDNEELVIFISIISLAGFLLTLFFSFWNWYLIIKGYTSIEFWGSRAGVLVKTSSEDVEQIKTFSTGKIKDHLFEVFGERNIFKILFLIRIKKLPFSGLEWSRYLDENFAIKGIEEVKDN